MGQYRSSLVGGLVIAVFALVMVVSLDTLTDAGLQISRATYPQADAVKEYKIELANFRLQFEKYQSGGSEQDLAQSLEHIENADDYIAAILLGSQLEGVQYAKIARPEIRDTAIHLRDDVAIIRGAINRVISGAVSVDDDDFKMEFEAVYANAVADSGAIEKALMQEIAGELDTFEFLDDILTDTILAIGVVIFLFFLRSEGNRARYLAELRESRKGLENRVEERTKELSAREAYIRSVVGSMVDGVITIDAMGSVLTFNDAAESIFGYEISEVVGQNIKMLMPDPYHSEHDEYLTNYHTTGVRKIIGMSREVAGRRKDGSTFPLSLAISEVAVGDEVRFTGIVRDISRFKEAESDLRTSQELLATAIENASDGFAIFDADDNLVRCNRKFRHLYSRSFDLIIPGNNLENILYEGAMRGEFEDATGREEIWTKEQMRNWRRGRNIYEQQLGGGLWLRATDVELPDGGHVCIRSDISEAKELQGRLEEARESAEQASKMKSDFLANMSHEIRTPMNAIIGMSHLALRTKLDDKQRDYVQKINGSADILLGIINDILDFSKIEAGKMEVETVEINLDDVLQTVSDMVCIKAEEKGLEFLVSRASGTPNHVIGDPLRLGQILLNLANNAIKFTDEGEVVIRIATIEQDSQNVGLHCSVRDTGIGLSEAQTEKLFQEFSQADASTTRKYGGTGLGLAICKSLVDLMRGEIGVESEVGKGSTFWFTVSMMRSDREKGEVDLSGLAESMRFLVVDDCETALEITENTLASFDFTSTGVKSGAEAIAELKRAAGTEEDPYDVVLLDWKMPGKDGIKVAGEIAELDLQEPAPKLVLVTGFGRDRARKQAPTGLLDGFVSKPVTPSTMLDTIMDVMGSARSCRGLKKAASAEREAMTDRLRDFVVLVAEDNTVNQQVAQELLEGFGASVTIAENGQEAVDILSSEPDTFDLVFMDLQMPVMDGFEATRVLRQDKRFDNLPIIAVTANAMSDDRDKCMAHGMDDYVSKPIDPVVLGRLLVDWIGTSDSDSPTRKVAEKRNAVDLPDALPGIDVAAGVRSLGGNGVLYVKLSAEFVEEHGDAIERIRGDLNGGGEASKETIRLVHTIKGILGTLGASEAQLAAQQLESALSDSKHAAANDFVDALDERFSTVMQSIDQLPEITIEVTAEAENSEQSRDSKEIIGELRQLLKVGDSDAEAVAQELLAATADSDHADLTKALLRQVSAFDFEEAQATLASIASGLGGRAKA